jgi:glutamate-1-semialdehyde 2,1-aminomutase
MEPTSIALTSLGAAALAALAPLAHRRLQLSRAKHPTLAGHSRMAKRMAGWIPGYAYDDARFFASDGAPAAVVAQRRAGFDHLAATLRDRHPLTLAAGREAAQTLSDLQFTGRYRVPFQYARLVREQLAIGSFWQSSEGVTLTDLDGQRFYDLTGSYGMNLLGTDVYKQCIAEGQAAVQALGPVLGGYHPLVLENLRLLREISGLDEVSFHMSGTEAVMQAVRLARYHTRRSHLVRFCGAYHGWWGEVQPGPGNPRPAPETYTLREMHPRTLQVLRTRRDIACVLVNPLQSLHPNQAAPADGSLIDSSRQAGVDREAYARWLRELRQVCTERGIVLILDEVFTGFRLAPRGAQEYFGVQADLVTYGKTLGGGLPVGVLCGKAALMKRYREDRPADICFARGTFNTHPSVMGAMNAFLKRWQGAEVQAQYEGLDERWQARAAALNQRLAAAGVPVRVAALSTIWTVTYTQPARYNWLLQHYLRADGLALSWVGTGRIVFSLAWTDAEFETMCERFVAATRAMQADGWWWQDPALSNQAIRRSVLRELLAHRF